MSDNDINDLSNDPEIIESFINEGYEMIDEVEPQLVELQHGTETHGEIDMEMLNSVFRLFHTLKGSAGFLEMKNLESVTHEAETLLDMYRSGKMELTPEHTNLLLKTTDFIRKIINNIEQYMDDKGLEPEVETMVKDITDISGSKDKNKKKVKKVKKKEKAKPEPQEQKEQPEVLDVQSLITPEMTEQYVKESLDLFDEIEDNLLKLEENINAPDCLNIVFGCFHTLKGNSGLMGYEDIAKITHKSESFLEEIKEKGQEILQSYISMLLSIIDVLRTAVKKIADNGSAKISNVLMMEEIIEEAVDEVSQIEVDDEEEEETSENEIIEQSDEIKIPEEKPVETLKTAEVKNQEKQPEAAASKASNKKETTPKKQAAPKRMPVDGGNNDKKSTSQPAKKSVNVQANIRVDLEKVDKLVDLVGELAISEGMVVHNPDIENIKHENFDRAAHNMHRIVSEIQYLAMSLRMVPVSGTFKKMVRLVHDISNKAEKKVKLIPSGEGTEIDKSVVDEISDPLVHIIRNAIDHGIESAEERKESGKGAVGTIVLDASHEEGEVWITVEDDGKGLNKEKIIAKAIERGLLKEPVENVSDNVIFNLIFEPGFSTAAKVTEISGRGVGMDVVKRNLEKVKGSIEVSSIPGKGSKFVMRIPLTLAMADGMLVKVGKMQYTIPLLSIRESIKVTPDQINVTPDGQEIINVRKQLIPVIRLHEIYDVKPDYNELTDGLLVVIEYRGRSFALLVDGVIKQEQFVIKGLPEYMGKIKGISACTILSNGEVSPIIDIGTLIHLAKNL